MHIYFSFLSWIKTGFSFQQEPKTVYLKYIYRFLTLFVSADKCYEAICKKVDEYTANTSNYLNGASLFVCVSLFNPVNICFKYSDFFPLKSAMFEGHLLPIPQNTHNILKRIYGDYKTPPSPEDKIANLHGSELHFNTDYFDLPL